jgi:hypothetical protein
MVGICSLVLTGREGFKRKLKRVAAVSLYENIFEKHIKKKLSRQ